MYSQDNTIVLLYTGVVTLANGKKGHLFYEITENSNTGSSFQEEPGKKRIYKKTPTGCYPGSIFRFHYNPENPSSIFVDTANLIGVWKNTEDVNRWKTASFAEEAEISKIRTLDKLNKRDIAETLKPFRDAYKACRTRKQRSAIIAFVVDLITH